MNVLYRLTRVILDLTQKRSHLWGGSTLCCFLPSSNSRLQRDSSQILALKAVRPQTTLVNLCGILMDVPLYPLSSSPNSSSPNVTSNSAEYPQPPQNCHHLANTHEDTKSHTRRNPKKIVLYYIIACYTTLGTTLVVRGIISDFLRRISLRDL
jgi:hypothetical protein